MNSSREYSSTWALLSRLCGFSFKLDLHNDRCPILDLLRGSILFLFFLFCIVSSSPLFSLLQLPIWIYSYSSMGMLQLNQLWFGFDHLFFFVLFCKDFVFVSNGGSEDLRTERKPSKISGPKKFVCLYPNLSQVPHWSFVAANWLGNWSICNLLGQHMFGSPGTTRIRCVARVCVIIYICVHKSRLANLNHKSEFKRAVSASQPCIN